MNFHALTPYWITRAGGIKANAALEKRDRPNYLGMIARPKTDEQNDQSNEIAGTALITSLDRGEMWSPLESSMPQQIQAGTILIRESQLFGLESAPYFGSWRVVRSIDSIALDREVRAAGWHFLFMGAEVKVMFLGAFRAKKIKNAFRRILGKMKGQDFNRIEVTGIIAKRFLRIPYTTVSAHSRHLQQSV